MKRVFLLCGLFSLFAGMVFSQSAGSTMYAAAKTVEVKRSKGAFAAAAATLKMGDSVTVVSVDGKWLQVRTSGNLTGWALKDSFSTRVVAATGNVTAKEVALAGKGFSAEAETEYRKDGLDYAPVDAIERIAVKTDDLEKFVIDGKLKGGE
jgi:uncharacterized protein YgiM (DUF1202 family)